MVDSRIVDKWVELAAGRVVDRLAVLAVDTAADTPFGEPRFLRIVVVGSGRNSHRWDTVLALADL